MSKRQKFVVSSVVLSFLFLSLQSIPIDWRYFGIAGLFVATYVMTAWALIEDLKGVEWLTILSLPALYSAGVAWFAFLLPEHWLARGLILVVFGLGMYALLLTENIFSVAAVRTIQLVRAANAVGFLLSIVTLVLFYNSIYSLQAHSYVIVPLVMVVSFPILLHGLWSVRLEEKVSKEVWGMSLGLALMLGQIALILSFLPVTVWIASLFLATVVYVVMGLLQQALNERLFQRTMVEYVGVGVIVLVATLLVTPWR